MRISPIFYLGMEGVGGIEMETDEDENVCHSCVFSATPQLSVYAPGH